MLPNAGIPGIAAAVESFQSAAEQGLSAAVMTMQVGQPKTACCKSIRKKQLIWCKKEIGVCVSRRCLGSSSSSSSSPPLWSQSLISPKMTTRSRPLSSRRKATLLRSTRRAAAPLEPESSRCLRGTKIPANSLTDTPDLTTRTPGVHAFSACTILARISLLTPCFPRGRRSTGLHHGYNRTLNRHLWLRLYCQQQLSQLRTYHQDPTSVGGLTADDIEKARQSKRAEIKPHKQAVNMCFFRF